MVDFRMKTIPNKNKKSLNKNFYPSKCSFMYGRRVFPEFVRFIEPENFRINANVKIAFWFKEILIWTKASVWPGWSISYSLLTPDPKHYQKHYSDSANYSIVCRGAASGRQTCREKRMGMVCHTAHSHRAIPGSSKPWKELLCFNCANPRGWREVQGWLFCLLEF